MPFNFGIHDREHDKFVECPTGETAVRVCVANETSDPVNISGDINIRAPTGPYEITVGSAGDTAANPIVTALPGRVSLSIRNKSSSVTMYFGKNISVTADDTATGGWEIGPGEDFNIDLDSTNVFFLITPAAQTAVYKILEIAST